MGRFEDKVALVTGASSGIGHGVAWRLASEGAQVVINHLGQAAQADALADEIDALGVQTLVIEADVSDRHAVQTMFEKTVDAFGRIDIAVANAAVSIREPVVDANWENALRTIEVSQFGVFHTCRCAARQMLRQPQQGRSKGKIVITGSILAELPTATSSAYNMSKAAINQLARTMANELASQQINVNVVNPGWIDTPGERAFATEEELAAAGPKLPWGRIGLPEDIAAAVAFLASDDADYITGSALRVDGGYMVGLTV